MDNSNRNPPRRQASKTSLEQSLKMISPPQQAPITIYPGPSASLSALSKADLDLANRLQNLRKSHAENVPTEEEMASRLAQLKGLPSDHYQNTQSAAAASYKKPDDRSQGQRVDDLLEQVMGEVAIEERAPKPEDELEARLARLRGSDKCPAQPRGAVALPPDAYRNQSQSGADASGSEDLGVITMDEVEAIMHAAEREASASAAQARADLEGDPELARAVAQATRKKEKKRSKKRSKGEGDTSDDERLSKSYGSDEDIDVGGKAIDPVTEQEEVQRIIDMYTKRAQLKKEKKRKKKEEAAAAGAGAVEGAVGGEDSDSDIEVSSESELSSDSEKFSESDELSD